VVAVITVLLTVAVVVTGRVAGWVAVAVRSTAGVIAVNHGDTAAGAPANWAVTSVSRRPTSRSAGVMPRIRSSWVVANWMAPWRWRW